MPDMTCKFIEIIAGTKLYEHCFLCIWQVIEHLDPKTVTLDWYKCAVFIDFEPVQHSLLHYIMV